MEIEERKIEGRGRENVGEEREGRFFIYRRGCGRWYLFRRLGGGRRGGSRIEGKGCYMV